MQYLQTVQSCAAVCSGSMLSPLLLSGSTLDLMPLPGSILSQWVESESVQSQGAGQDVEHSQTAVRDSQQAQLWQCGEGGMGQDKWSGGRKQGGKVQGWWAINQGKAACFSPPPPTTAALDGCCGGKHQPPPPPLCPGTAPPDSSLPSPPHLRGS